MGGWFGGALTAMQVMGEMQARLEYRLLGSEEQEIAEELPTPAKAVSGWRRSLARTLMKLSERIAPELQPTGRLEPCPC